MKDGLRPLRYDLSARAWSVIVRTVVQILAALWTLLASSPVHAIPTETIRVIDREGTRFGGNQSVADTTFVIDEPAITGTVEPPFIYDQDDPPSKAGVGSHSAERFIAQQPHSVFLLEPGSCPPGGCPEPTGESPQTISDVIQLTITPDPSGVGRDFYKITVFSDPNPSIGGLLPGAPTYTENGNPIDISFGLFKGYTNAAQLPLQVTIQSCSTPCNTIPEPSTLLLFGTGLAGVLGCGWHRRQAGKS